MALSGRPLTATAKAREERERERLTLLGDDLLAERLQEVARPHILDAAQQLTRLPKAQHTTHDTTHDTTHTQGENKGELELLLASERWPGFRVPIGERRWRGP
jgi:hypothetical protein